MKKILIALAMVFGTIAGVTAADDVSPVQASHNCYQDEGSYWNGWKPCSGYRHHKVVMIYNSIGGLNPLQRCYLMKGWYFVEYLPAQTTHNSWNPGTTLPAGDYVVCNNAVPYADL